LEAVARLDEVTRRLRRECPWDREQDERTIVPHTVEEAYELADAAYRGDDGRLLDELGDVLFQVEFLALLLEERGAGDLGAVADHCVQKLIRRHPHVFGSLEVSSADEVLRNWDQIKRGEQGREPGLFGDVPETLPGLLYARKLLRRAGVAGSEGSVEAVREKVVGLEGVDTPEAQFERLGDVLFELVALARRLRVDPELALRAAADRFRERALEAAAASGVSGEERA
jgi:XTP/dITP diphosphohydrolase/tetrapyrrole methylase family protein/MazG family protein/ATP diphosphatase